MSDTSNDPLYATMSLVRIAEMNPESIAEKLSLLYHKNEIREKLKANLLQEKLGNENEVEKLYQLIHS